MNPSLFVSHGAPTLPFDEVPARAFLQSLGEKFEKPKGIVIASAHWETKVPAVNGMAVNGTGAGKYISLAAPRGVRGTFMPSRPR